MFNSFNWPPQPVPVPEEEKKGEKNPEQEPKERRTLSQILREVKNRIFEGVGNFLSQREDISPEESMASQEKTSSLGEEARDLYNSLAGHGLRQPTKQYDEKEVAEL